ncbi:hypothetical protein B0O99DRAFT_253261 [Bisporella sp. PMI_857]|nr:hypothetical protein B0O99DRAFT_253261 [Bisporella sp. PMI_857]
MVPTNRKHFAGLDKTKAHRCDLIVPAKSSSFDQWRGVPCAWRFCDSGKGGSAHAVRVLSP